MSVRRQRQLLERPPAAFWRSGRAAGQGQDDAAAAISASRAPTWPAPPLS